MVMLRTNRMQFDLGVGEIVAIIASVITAWKAFTFRGIEHDKADAEASDIYQDVATKSAQHASTLLDRVLTLEGKVSDLKSDVEFQEDHIRMLVRGICQLTDQIRAAGMDPIWEPPPYKKGKKDG